MRNTSGLFPQAAKKSGKLEQKTIQLPHEAWAKIDRLVQMAKSDPRCTYPGRIGRGDIIRGLLKAADLLSIGVAIDGELIAAGIHRDEDGDCLLCGSAGYIASHGIDSICPLCQGEG